MKLILLHGAPAAVLKAVPGRLFDNHASMDLTGTVFEFDAPGSPVPRSNCLMLDTGTLSADAAAQEIIRPFGLAPS